MLSDKAKINPPNIVLLKITEHREQKQIHICINSHSMDLTLPFKRINQLLDKNKNNYNPEHSIIKRWTFS